MSIKQGQLRDLPKPKERRKMSKKRPHIVVIPAPGQGHINSLLHLSHKLITSGFHIIFVNTEYNHRRIFEAAADHKNGLPEEITFVSFPDGVDPEAYRTEFGKLSESMVNFFPKKLEELIKRFNSESDQDQGLITCVIADVVMSWTLEVANKLGVKGALHWPMPASFLVLQSRWRELLENGVIDSDGFPLKNDKIQLHPSMPVINVTSLPWYTCGTSTEDRKLLFKFSCKYIEGLNLSDWWICNSVLELEPEAFKLSPKLRPIGPLVSSSTIGGQLWSEDLSCLAWLDEQKPRSVVYISFGSLTIFNLEQFEELAIAVHALGRPVLWVVRSDFTTNGSEIEFPYQFQGNHNTKIVRWAPQLRVLSHGAVACFVSHCGWNSTMEAVANGVPFLCWPYFADQFINQSYICDIWKVGLCLEKNENGLVTREEVRAKVEQLLGDQGIQDRALMVKEVSTESMSEGGNSARNFDDFIKWLGQ